MAVYLISDTHFGHKNILKWRDGFNTIEEHDEYIKESILRRCSKRDSLYILGDVCLGTNSFDHLFDISCRVEHLHICLGNHDQERKGSPSLRQYMAMCKSIFGMKKYKNAWFTHAPLHPCELRGKINIHGHVHSRSIEDPRYFNVCCENIDYTPINVEDILGFRHGLLKGG